MKILIASTILIAGIGLVGGTGLPQAAAADTDKHELSPKFPQSDKCTTSSPCRDVIGEVIKVEESYWIRMPDGHETHMRVSADTKIDSRVKVGDPIAAQMTSSGMAESIKKLKELPKADELSIPKKTKEVEAETTLKDIRNK